MYNYKIQKRRQFEIENKNKLKHNMRTVSIAFRKKKSKDTVKFDVLLCLDTIAMKISFSHI